MISIIIQYLYPTGLDTFVDILNNIYKLNTLVENRYKALFSREFTKLYPDFYLISKIKNNNFWESSYKDLCEYMPYTSNRYTKRITLDTILEKSPNIIYEVKIFKDYIKIYIQLLMSKNTNIPWNLIYDQLESKYYNIYDYDEWYDFYEYNLTKILDNEDGIAILKILIMDKDVYININNFMKSFYRTYKIDKLEIIKLIL